MAHAESAEFTNEQISEVIGGAADANGDEAALLGEAGDAGRGSGLMARQLGCGEAGFSGSQRGEAQGRKHRGG